MAEISSLTQIPSVEQLVTQFASRERGPVKRLEQKKISLNQRRATLTDLKSNLSSLRTRVKGFTDVGTAAKLGAKKAVSSDDSFFTVEVDSTAVTGINTILISQVAKNDLAVSDSISNGSNSIASSLVGTTQQFTIQIGSGSAQTISISITDPSETNEDLLRRIAEKINTNIDGVSATVVSNKKNKIRLSIISKESGSDNEVSFTDTSGSQLLEDLGFITNSNSSRKSANSSQGGFITSDTDDLDAIFEINGIEITSSSNTITGVLRGVTIELRKSQKSGSDPETFSISNDEDVIKEEIKDFIKEYNKALTFLTDRISVDTETNKRGPLSGNFTFINLRLQLREIVSNPVSDAASGDPSLLTEIGIKINNDGTLVIDNEDELDEAIAEDANAVTGLFTSDLGVANKLIDLLDKFTLVGTTIDKNLSSIRSQSFSIDRQISQFESRFRIREEGLRRRFTDLERSLTILNSQQVLLQRFGFSSNNLFQFGSRSTTGQSRNLLF